MPISVTSHKGAGIIVLSGYTATKEHLTEGDTVKTIIRDIVLLATAFTMVLISAAIVVAGQTPGLTSANPANNGVVTIRGFTWG